MKNILYKLGLVSEEYLLAKEIIDKIKKSNNEVTSTDTSVKETAYVGKQNYSIKIDNLNISASIGSANVLFHESYPYININGEQLKTKEYQIYNLLRRKFEKNRLNRIKEGLKKPKLIIK
jgi:hypothetical protein